jgi:hypothetical protein
MSEGSSGVGGWGGLLVVLLLSRNDSVEVERLDLKTLDVRANARERVGVNALHHSVVSFS